MNDKTNTNDRWLAIFAGLVIVITLVISIYAYAAPAVLPASSAESEFSAARAMQHLKVIAREPHPLGSKANKQVRDYIIRELTALGFEVQLQRRIQLDKAFSPPFAGNVENILVRRRGTANSKALLLMAHYDSVAIAPGAGDDGCGVAALLETVRALQHHQPLRNDLILLFSDGEEIGLLGAHAFVKEHPWVNDVGLALNFEGRGNGGPALMFETSSNNGRLIEEFASVAPYPFASSLTYEAYRHMPNDTDMTVLKNKGLAGLNFAYVNGIFRYHTINDTPENFDARSLQHTGSYALAMTRHFGNLPLTELSAPDLIYFDLLGKIMIRYSQRTGQLLTGVTLLLLLSLLIIGYRQKQLTIVGVVVGALSLLLSLAGAGALAFGAITLIRKYDAGRFWVLFNYANNSDWYMSGIAALTVTLSLSLFILLRARFSLGNLFAGALLWWTLLMILTTIYLPGVSYLFTWPLLSALPVLAILLKSDRKLPQQLLILAGAIPALLLLGHISYLLYVTLTLSLAMVVVVTIVLMIGAVLPALDLIITRQRWLLPLMSSSAGVILMIYAVLIGSHNQHYPKPDQICYWLDGDSGQAQWLSLDSRVDTWTSQFFAADTKREPVPEFETRFDYRFLHKTAPQLSLTAPQVELISNTESEQQRIVKVRVSSPRQANIIYLEVDSALNGVTIGDEHNKYNQYRNWGLYFWGLTADGLELTFEMAKDEPLKIKVADQSYGLLAIPELRIKPRPAEFMPMPHNPLDNSLFVSKRFQF